MNIEDYREKQWQNYRDTALVDAECVELIECKCCGYEVEETEIKRTIMHDMNDAKQLPYCLECIEVYKKENL